MLTWLAMMSFSVIVSPTRNPEAVGLLLYFVRPVLGFYLCDDHKHFKLYLVPGTGFVRGGGIASSSNLVFTCI